jgi:hypothetical protein
MQGEIPPCIPDRITSAKCRINIIVSPDDEHLFARNMWSKIKHTKKIVKKLALFTRLYRYTRLAKPKNIKKYLLFIKIICVASMNGM